ncbi:ATPase, T2SS/T4P/T4SS family [Brevibacillus centrosporus]|uniref:ATPase, T2SS/T4P/T4SS family n=1 Tax=Brevibacillus centrosporus TaxID=54910 RepID=UPI003B012B2F
MKDKQYFIDKTKEYFTSMKEIDPKLQEEVKQQLQAAAQGKQEAKDFLARQLQTYFTNRKEIPTETLYPNVPIFLSLIFHTFGQKALDAMMFQSPYIENVWIWENRPIQYLEHGILKTYDYVPTSDELEVLLNDLAHISGGTIHQKRSVLSGDFAERRLRLQMYTRPRSARTVIARKDDSGYFTLDTLEMDDRVRKLLKQIAASNSSISIAGGQETGKTTLMRALILEKDPDTNSLTVIEQTPELKLSERWGKVVVEIRYVEEEPFEVTFGHAFRNTTRSIAVGEARYPFEAHYVIESGLRSPGFTFATLHLKVSSPDVAMRTFENLVYQYRKDDRIGIRQDIADGIDFFLMLSKNYRTGKRYISSIFCPRFDPVTEKLQSSHLVYYDEQENEYVWTGKKIPEEKRSLFLTEPKVDIDVLTQLGVW